MNRLGAWVSQMLSGHAGPSAARVAYVAYVVCGAAWLTVDLVLRRAITPEWNMAFTVYGSSCTAGYIGGKVAGRTPPAPPSA
jgi:type IV secretory pathway VirB2 component (pilin)